MLQPTNTESEGVYARCLRITQDDDAKSILEYMEKVLEQGQQGKLVIRSGIMYEIAPEGFKAMTGKLLDKVNGATSKGNFILRNGKPIYHVNPGGRPENVFVKATKLMMEDGELCYMNNEKPHKLTNRPNTVWLSGEGANDV